jgi:hypothetical protein
MMCYYLNVYFQGQRVKYGDQQTGQQWSGVSCSVILLHGSILSSDTPLKGFKIWSTFSYPLHIPPPLSTIHHKTLYHCSSNCVHLLLLRKHISFTARQATYVSCNNEARSPNHFCSGKAANITYCERVSVGFGIHHVMRMRRVILSFVAWPALPYFIFHFIS